MIILGCFGGTTILGNTQITITWKGKWSEPKLHDYVPCCLGFQPSTVVTRDSPWPLRILNLLPQEERIAFQPSISWCELLVSGRVVGTCWTLGVFLTFSRVNLSRLKLDVTLWYIRLEDLKIMLITYYIWMILDDHLLPIKTMFCLDVVFWTLEFCWRCPVRFCLNSSCKLFGTKLQVGPNGPHDVNAYLIADVLKLMASVDWNWIPWR